MKLGTFNHDELDLVQFEAIQPGQKVEHFPPTARYMESPVFSVFKYCFVLSCPGFAYKKINLYSKSQIVSLRNHLLTNFARLKAIDSDEDLQLFSLRHVDGLEFMNALKTCYPDWRLSWENIREKLVAINTELIDMIDTCIDDDKNFYIKGY